MKNFESLLSGYKKLKSDPKPIVNTSQTILHQTERVNNVPQLWKDLESILETYYNSKSNEETPNPEERNLGILFIIVDDFPNEILWRLWINNSRSVRCWFHAKYPDKIRSSWVRERLVNSFHLHPQWASIELTKTMLGLLAEAVQSKFSINRFIFASESCIPVITLDKCLDLLYKQNNYSWMLSTHKPNDGYSKTQQFDELAKSIPREFITKADQWVMISRFHAIQLLDFLAKLDQLYNKISPDNINFTTKQQNDSSKEVNFETTEGKDDSSKEVNFETTEGKDDSSKEVNFEATEGKDDSSKEVNFETTEGKDDSSNDDFILSQQHNLSYNLLYESLSPKQYISSKIFQAFRQVRASDEIFFPTIMCLLGFISSEAETSPDQSYSIPHKLIVRTLNPQITLHRSTYCDWSEGKGNPRLFETLPKDLTLRIHSTNGANLSHIFFRKIQFKLLNTLSFEMKVQELEKYWKTVSDGNKLSQEQLDFIQDFYFSNSTYQNEDFSHSRNYDYHKNDNNRSFQKRNNRDWGNYDSYYNSNESSYRYSNQSNYNSRDKYSTKKPKYNNYS